MNASATHPTVCSPLRGLAHSELAAAFEAMCWRGWTLKAALADPVRARIVVARACATRTRTQQRQRQRARTQ
jgi:hypothetical protein